MRLEASAFKRLRNRQIAAPNVDHVRQRYLYIEFDFEAWIVEAEVTSAVIVHEPPTPLADRLVGEIDLDNRAPLAERRRLHALFHRPYEEAEVDLVFRQLAA